MQFSQKIPSLLDRTGYVRKISQHRLSDLLFHYSAESVNRLDALLEEAVEVIQFDSKITTEKPQLLKQATNGIRVIGRGGTNFQPAIDFYYEHEEYDGLIFLTDGYAPVPKLPDDKRHKPLAWILTTQGGNEDNLKPLGPVVRITGL